MSQAAAVRVRNPLSVQALPGMALVYLLYLLAAWVGQYIFFVDHSSPAVIWAPAGIALSAVLIGGYRMAIPVLLAQLTAGLTGYGPMVAWSVAFQTIGYALQPLYLGFALRRLGFTGSIETIADAFILIGVALVGTAIFPGVFALTHAFFRVSDMEPTMLTDFGRLWAGNLLSVLVIVPLVTSWLRSGRFAASPRQLIEIVLSFVILTGCIYFIFWSHYAGEFGLPLVLILWSVLFWIALRLAPRFMSAAIALSTAIAFLGGIIVHPTSTPLASQLFGDELIILLFSPLFLVFAAAAAERRNSAKELALRVEELDALAIRLSADDQAKNDFIAVLAHELRNPLSPIVSTLELLQLHASSSESQELIRDAQLQAGTMRRLLDDLLDVARISRNKLTIRKEPVDVREIVRRSLVASASTTAERRHDVSVELPEESIWVDADPVRLEQVIVNVLNNAARYTETGGSIRISCARDHDRAVISVRDNGIGIKENDLDAIFEPFRQSVEPHKQGGLGIGLSITKRLVELHGGEIRVESEGTLSRGSRFTIQLPLGAPPRNSIIQDDVAPHRPFRILVVDDNKPAAVGLGKLLAHEGHSVSLAHTGTEALERIMVEQPSVVLLDIGLPDVDGYRVAQRARAGGSSATLIALTGYGQEDDKRKAQDAGFNFHLTKPVSIAEIDDVLHAIPPSAQAGL